MSLDRDRGWFATVLLGVLLLVECATVSGLKNVTVLNITDSLSPNDTLVSKPLGHFELGIFEFVKTEYYLCIRYRLPIQQVVTWVANRTTPLSNSATLRFDADGTLKLVDPNNNNIPGPIWSFPTSTPKVGGVGVKAELLDTGELVVLDTNGTKIWNSFKNSSPTDTLLPGQYLYREQKEKLISWQKDGSPATNNGTYSFGWSEKNILCLSWTTPITYLNWQGGTYIPALDVHHARSISDVDFVYFHPTLGHLYISSLPSNTAILSGGPDKVNATILKRITVDKDGGFRIWQWTIGQNSTSWKAMANWVVSERPDSRSQCTTFGTCGPYGMCTSPMDSLDLVQCKCPSGAFEPINANDLTQGCKVPMRLNTTDCKNAEMLVLEDVDMPWGGDYQNLTGPDSANCLETCKSDCNCTGAVLSRNESMCWLKSGFMLNVNYPTVALHGNDRTAFIKLLYDPRTKPADPVIDIRSSRKTPFSQQDTILVSVFGPLAGILLVFVVCICSKRVRRCASNCCGVTRRSAGGCLSRCCGVTRRSDGGCLSRCCGPKRGHSPPPPPIVPICPIGGPPGPI